MFYGPVLTYTLDETKIGDRAEEQLIDAGLGISKALTLKGTFNYFGVRGATPAAAGVGLGIVGREMEGPSLAEYARYASGNPGRNVTRKDLLENLLSNSSFQDSYSDAILNSIEQPAKSIRQK